MEIREKQSLIKLFFYSFQVINQSAASLFMILLMMGIGGAIEFAGMHFGLSRILLQLFNVVWFAIWPVVLIRIISAKAEGNSESFSDSCVSSVLPTIYIFIMYMVLGLLFGVLVFVGRAVLVPIVNYKTAVVILLIALVFVAFRLIFAQYAIALREQNPISAIAYSWNLTKGKNLVKILGAFIISTIFPIVVAVAIGVGIYVGIPLYFADSFHLANLTLPWMCAFAAIGIIFGLIWVSMKAFLVLVFLNIDYGENRSSFTPAPQVVLQEQPTQVFGTNNNVLPPGAGQTVQASDVKVQVTQASIKSDMNEETSRHLEQVYTPGQHDVIEYAEEDRMPTILFDDVMAQQLEQERAMFQQKMQQDKTEKEDGDSNPIKMSK